jgi:hypothetical protein
MIPKPHYDGKTSLNSALLPNTHLHSQHLGNYLPRDKKLLVNHTIIGEFTKDSISQDPAGP